MIDAKTLRAGNKILDSAKQIQTIVFIEEHGAVVDFGPWRVKSTGKYWSGSGDDKLIRDRIVVPYSEAEPIEITGEWFEKLGFLKASVPHFYLNGAPAYEICIMKSADRWLLLSGRYHWLAAIWENHNWRNSASIGRDVLYVHDLQNLFYFLTGKELEAKQ